MTSEEIAALALRFRLAEEAPAMQAALRKAADLIEAEARRYINDGSISLHGAALRLEATKIRAILARIDGATNA